MIPKTSPVIERSQTGSPFRGPEQPHEQPLEQLPEQPHEQPHEQLAQSFVSFC